MDQFRVFDPGREAIAEHDFGDERARYDHPLIDIKAVIAEPGFMRQVGGRFAGVDALADQRQYGLGFLRQQVGIEIRFQFVVRQVQRMQDEVGSLVARIGAAVAEMKAGFAEAAYGKTQQIAHGEKILVGLVKHGRILVHWQ